MNRSGRAALAACAALAAATALTAPAAASPAPAPRAAASASASVRAGDPAPLDFETRHRLHHAIVMTDPAQDAYAYLLSSGIDVQRLVDVLPDEYLDEEGRQEVERRLAEAEEFFADDEGVRMIRDLTATPQWQEAVTRGMIAADARVGEKVLLLVGADRYLDGPAAETHGEAVSFQVNRERSPGVTIAVLHFSGELTWSGEGNRTYTVRGMLQARCQTQGTHTVWLQHGAGNESWKDSEETGCSASRGSTSRDITVSGTLAPGQSLDLRLGTWRFASWQYSGTKTYAPAPA
ncbi:hypothetical protein [Kitasatospora sp. NPDC093806]|uniref:hypothetical protein n=1 Tax=Kitasatospora sp. NPDC093806 TaxID=3155075 RepID=UPI003446C38A